MRKKSDDVGARLIPQEESLAIYLKGIANSTPLTSAEEAQLTARIRKGDRKALDKLVLANLRFVISVSRNYQNQGLPLSDLINEGNIGLIRAARRFDERKNFRFISYAVWWIRQAILQALADNSRIVRLPLNRVGSIHKMGAAQRRLEQRLHRSPTHEEVAEELGMSIEALRTMLQVGNRHVSLDASIDGHGELRDPSTPTNDDSAAEKSMAEQSIQRGVDQALKSLSPKEAAILKLSFGIGQETTLTLDEIGQQFGITRERVRQIREKALQKLKTSSTGETLKALLMSQD